MNDVLQILFVLALMSVGIFARRRGLTSETGTKEMARLLVAVVYPCLVVSSVVRLDAAELLARRAMPLLTAGIAAAGFLLGTFALRLLPAADRRKTGAFLFQSAINNYLFLPLPLVLWRWGEEGVALLIFSSLGFEATLWSLGVAWMRRGAAPRNAAPRPGFFSPPLVALLLSLSWVFARDLAGVRIPPHLPRETADLFLAGAQAIGNATIALSMLVAGSRIATLRFGGAADPHVFAIVAIRLLAVPLLFLSLLKCFAMDDVAYGILAVVAVMPTAIAGIVFAERFDGDAEFVGTTLVLTHLAALVTVPLLLAWALN